MNTNSVNILVKEKQENPHLNKINEWVRSYFILFENNTLVDGPVLNLESRTNLAKYVYDANKITNLIESTIKEQYSSQNVSVLLNCAKNLNTPTQEFYTRYLTEMHKSSGIEDLGQFKTEIIFIGKTY